MPTDMAQHKPGLVVEIREGESVCLRGINGVDSEKIVLILESKDGRKARVRAYEAMTDASTGVGPTPLESQVAGGL